MPFIKYNRGVYVMITLLTKSHQYVRHFALVLLVYGGYAIAAFASPEISGNTPGHDSGTATASIIWFENFTFCDGTTVDNGSTSWSVRNTGPGTFSVENNEFMASFNTAREGMWVSEVIDISGISNAVIAADLRSGTSSTREALENDDYIRVYYKLNGGAETLVYGDVAGLNDVNNATSSRSISSGSINGSTLQIIIRAKNSSTTERYYFDNVKLSGTFIPPDLTASGGVLSCATSITLTASSSVAGATYRWIGPNGFSSNLQNPAVSVPGTYTVTVTNPKTGATASKAVQVTGTAATAATLWLEDFDLPNGTTKDTGITSWSAQETGSGTFAVKADEFRASCMGNHGEGIWTSGTINISGKGNVSIEANVRSKGISASGNCSDYLKFYYKIDGGAAVLFSEKSGSINNNSGANTTVSVNSLNGASLKIIVKARASGSDDFYYFDNIKVSGSTPASLDVTATASSSTLTCTTSSVTLTASSSTSGLTYRWTGPGTITNPASAITTVNTPGTYTVTATSPSAGCTASATVVIQQNTTAPQGVTAATSGTLSCTTTSINLTGTSTTSGVTYRWTGPGTITHPTSAVTAVNAPGIYTLHVTNPANGCTATTAVLVQQNSTAPQNVTASSSGLLTCTTTAVTLTGASTTSDVTYQWSGPGTITNPTSAIASVNTPGTYTLTVTNPSNGCTASVPVDVQQNILQPQDVTVTPSADMLTCATTSLTLTGSSSTDGVTYHWSGPETITDPSSASASVNTPGTYTLVVTNPANGCTADKTFPVQQNIAAPQDVTAAASGLLTCATTWVTLTGASTTSGVTYQWTGPGTITHPAAAVTTVNAYGTYALTVTDPVNGCSTPATAMVQQNITPPNINVSNTTGTTTLTCYVNLLTLTGSTTATNATYVWTSNNGFTANTLTATISAPGTYTFSVTGSNGCVASRTRTITQITNAPAASAIASGVLNCDTTFVDLIGSSSGSPVTYNWTGPGTITNPSTATATVSEPGIYTLTITTPGGCTDTETVEVIDAGCTRAADQTNARMYKTTAVPENTENTFESQEQEVTATVYPNPVVGHGTIEFTTDQTYAVLEVFTIMSTKIATLYNGAVEPGKKYSVRFETDRYSNGVYIYRITSKGRKEEGKIIIAH
jgi:hypothetical protein